MTVEQLLGIDKATQNWNKNYGYAKQFYEENGHLIIPRDYIVDGYQIGRWVETQKNRKRGILGKPLTKIEIEKLEAIGIVWEQLFDFKWNNNYEYAKKYYEENGHLIIPRDYIVDGHQIGDWINYQRSSYKNGTLSDKKIKLLESIGMVWNLRKYNFLTKTIDGKTKRSIKITLLKELKNILEESNTLENIEEKFVKKLEM